MLEVNLNIYSFSCFRILPVPPSGGVITVILLPAAPIIGRFTIRRVKEGRLDCHQFVIFLQENIFVSLTFTGLTFDLILYSEKFSLPKTCKVSSVGL